jgi:hypothetical protein
MSDNLPEGGPKWWIERDAYEQDGRSVHQVMRWSPDPCGKCGGDYHTQLVMETEDLALAEHIVELHNASTGETLSEVVAISEALESLEDAISFIDMDRGLPGDPPSPNLLVLAKARTALESLSARVTQAETTVAEDKRYVEEADRRVAQALHDGWERGFDDGEADVFQHDETGWDGAHGEQCISNPYPAPTAPGTGNESEDTNNG